jgi:hypothetical protein
VQDNEITVVVLRSLSMRPYRTVRKMLLEPRGKEVFVMQ